MRPSTIRATSAGPADLLEQPALLLGRVGPQDPQGIDPIEELRCAVADLGVQAERLLRRPSSPPGDRAERKRDARTQV